MAGAPEPSPLYVVAGALIDPAGRVLLAARPAGKPHAGRWEFPGGKRADGEAPRETLVRELAEELGIEVLRARPLLVVTHRYPGAAAPVVIDCWQVDAWRGTPAALDGQQLRWCTRAELACADILEADRAIVTALRLPRLFVRLSEPAELAGKTPEGSGRARTAWLVDGLPGDAGVTRRLLAYGDRIVVIDPPAPAAVEADCLYTRPDRFERPAGREAVAGRLVQGAAEARAAAAAGADYLLVARRSVSATELTAIAALGLPWYLNVVEAHGASGAVPTGRLWWKDPPAGG